MDSKFWEFLDDEGINWEELGSLIEKSKISGELFQSKILDNLNDAKEELERKNNELMAAYGKILFWTKILKMFTDLKIKKRSEF